MSGKLNQHLEMSMMVIETIRKAWVAIQWGVGNILIRLKLIDMMGYCVDKSWTVEYYRK